MADKPTAPPKPAAPDKVQPLPKDAFFSEKRNGGDSTNGASGG